MSNKRRQYSAALKAQVGLEALKNIDPVHAIAAKHKVHPTQVNLWKKEVAERLPELFTKSVDADAVAAKEREQELYAEIGKLKMQLEWLKKNLARMGIEDRRRMIESTHPKLPVTEQCALLGLPRSSYYHRPQPAAARRCRG